MRSSGGRNSSGSRRAFRALLLASVAALAGISAILGLVMGAERLLNASVHVQAGLRSAAVYASQPEPAFGMARFPMTVAQQWFEVSQFMAANEKVPALAMPSYKIASVEAVP
ncbi:MAG: hypothetical protein ACXWCS_29875, partial [Burkholderiales bacterium]